MNACERENELLETLTLGQWPHSAAAELRSHVDRCARCADLVSVAGALLEDRHDSEAHVVVPSSGATWWRVRLRAEREEREHAARTVEMTQSISHTAIMVAVIAAVTTLVGSAWAWFGKMPSLAPAGRTLLHMLPSQGVLLLGIVTLIMLAPVALYLVFARD